MAGLVGNFGRSIYELVRRPIVWAVLVGLIVTVAVKLTLPDVLSLSNAIMGYTAWVIICYTAATAAMEEEIARQTDVELRPAIVGREVGGELELLNAGKGVAVNIEGQPLREQVGDAQMFVELDFDVPRIMQPGESCRPLVRAFIVDSGVRHRQDLFDYLLTPMKTDKIRCITLDYDRY